MRHWHSIIHLTVRLHNPIPTFSAMDIALLSLVEPILYSPLPMPELIFKMPYLSVAYLVQPFMYSRWPVEEVVVEVMVTKMEVVVQEEWFNLR